MPGPKHSKKAYACDYLICKSGKESECDALAKTGYFFLGSGRLDPVVIRKMHPKLILRFIKVAGLK